MIHGGLGDDLLLGWGGDDWMDGGEGDDLIDGGAGDDVIFGGLGNDLIYARIDNDEIHGGEGEDLIEGGDGADLIYGDEGDDVIRAGLGNDEIYGGAGQDELWGGRSNDWIDGGSENDEIDGGGGSDRVFGGDGDDRIISKQGNDFLDGQSGDDSYLLYYEGGLASSLITVLDSGSLEGTDAFIATGTVYDDQFLLRADASGSNAFAALLNDPDKVERINYTGVERIVINGSFGDDHFAMDDTAAEATLNGEYGDDTFQIGQLFRSQRTPEAANVSVDDVFATIETTRGFLSNGISAPMTINGGDGEDRFVVFHNKAVLSLYGDGGDDEFEVRAFALSGSQEPKRERTDISGGAGADLVQYAVNAPVNIDGGDGLDTLTVFGTEFGDDFVITKDGVFGAGLTINFVNIETLKVDGAEGDDRFYVQSTGVDFLTEIYGGLGADTFNMSGDAPPVVSNDLLGHSGLVLHEVESSDPRYDGQKLFGVSANVADNDEPFVVIRQTNGSTIISEGDSIGDSYEIVLTRKPDTEVFVKALAPVPTSDSREKNALSFRLDSPTGEAKADGSVVTLTFTPDNWYIPQTVEVLADQALMQDTGEFFTRPELGDGDHDGIAGVDFQFDDNAIEGLRFGVINHLVIAGSESIQGVPEKLIPSPALTIAIPADANLADFTPSKLIGCLLQITSGAGAGQERIITGADIDADAGEIKLSLDRAWLPSDVPNENSKYLLAMDKGDVEGEALAVDNPTITITDSGALESGEFLGRKVEIISGPGAGQNRFVVAAVDNANGTFTLTLDRGWNLSDLPTAEDSEYLLRIDDALVGVMTDFEENAFSDADDVRSLFIDSGADFPTEGEGLTGAVLQIVGGPGAGQQRLILGHEESNPTATLILNGSWEVDPVAGESLYRIERYDGLAIPSLQVQINDNDQAGLIVDETHGFNNGAVVDDWDTITAVIEGGNGDYLGEKDVLQIQLSRDPGTTVEVALNYDAGQLLVKDLSGATIDGANTLSFNSDNWDVSQKVIVEASDDVLREGFHTSLIEFDIVEGSSDEILSITDAFEEIPSDDPIFYVGLSRQPVEGTVTVTLDDEQLVADQDYKVFGNKIVFLDDSGDYVAVSGEISVDYEYVNPGFVDAYTDPVLARINDNDAPTVLVRETGGSTDVIEVKMGGSDPESIPEGESTDQSPWIDYYELVLTAKPEGEDGAATVTVTPDITKTTRTGGIRHDDVQVEISSKDARVQEEMIDGAATGNLIVSFNEENWDEPVVIQVQAVDDPVVDGGDTKEFAPGPNTVSGILGPVVIDGAGGRGSLSGLPAPVMLPGETNIKEKTGDVIQLEGVSVTVHTEDLNAALDKFGLLDVSELVNKTIEITAVNNPGNLLHSAIGQFRLITGVSAGENGETLLTLNEAFELSEGESEGDIKSYVITAESLNFFVDETEQVDYMFVHDEDSPADSAGTLTSTRLSGLNMGPNIVIGDREIPGGITYGNLEALEINLGAGMNHFNVLGTHAREDGFQTWTFINTGDDIPYPYQELEGDFVTVKIIAEEEITASGSVESAQNPGSALNPFKTTVTIDESFEDGSLAGQLIQIGGDGSGQTRRIIDNTGNVLTVDEPWESMPGENNSYKIIHEADGAIAINTQGGNDIVDASNSSRQMIIFGGEGTDQITGGQADDIIFGDKGRIDYFDEDGEIVTRLGLIRDDSLGNGQPNMGMVDEAGSDSLTDHDVIFPTENGGLAGLIINIING
ncbi:MAG: calcium-binding protein, partial [Candidatus Hinthialibacter sp.]